MCLLNVGSCCVRFGSGVQTDATTPNVNNTRQHATGCVQTDATCKGDVTRDDSQRRLLAHHSVATLLRHCFDWLQHCSNIAALCSAKNRCRESSCVRLHGAIHVPQHLLFSHHAPLVIFLYVCRTESKKNPMLPCGLGSKAFPFSFFFFSITFIEIAVCYWPRESQDHWIVSKFFQKQKGGRGNSQLYWTKHLSLSCCTSHYRSMQEVQLDKHVKLVDSPGIVMDNSNSDSAVILRNCVKVRFHSVVQEWPTLIFS